MDDDFDYGDILDQLDYEAEVTYEYPDLDEPWDEILAEQELWDHEQSDEFFGHFGGDEDW